MSTLLQLNVCLLGKDRTVVFPVEIPSNESVEALKKVIKDLFNLEDDTFDLWNVSIPFNKDLSQVALHLKKNEPLSPVEIVGELFNGSTVEKKHINIIVRSATLSASNSVESNSNQPSINDHWSPRSGTVHHLFDILMQEKLVHVRGTPGCGKTTLKELLHDHILRQRPEAFVYVVNSWPQNVSGRLTERLQEVDSAYPKPTAITFLLFDEGQDSYQDHILWNTFFKNVHDGFYDKYFVILFCSYGSPSSRPVSYEIGTPLSLRDSARVSLWPTVENHIGLLLNRSEFDEVIARRQQKLNLHPDLLDLFFNLTAGHVGAVIELLNIVSHQRVAEMRQGIKFTVDTFHAENPLHSLIQQLRGGAFGRGLPGDRELSENPDITAFLRLLIRDGEVEEEDETKDAIHKCHRNGWIYAHLDPTSSIICYTFASPLHSAFISWILKPSNDMPKYSSAFELCFAVISKFKPSQMYIPIRRVSATSTMDPLPEAQYQDEFYRSVFTATAGNVRISPEFASARKAHVMGRIDFFIPIMKWGIEIVRDGDRLQEHNSRFESSGAYGAWLQSGDMSDYILLDFRTEVPRKAHPNIPNLFHVVFSNEYREVTLHNNEAKKVGDTIALLENQVAA